VGTAFFVMEFLEGRIFWHPQLESIAGSERAAYYDAMNATIAKLHGVDYTSIGLGDYGRPGSYLARQIAVWSRQYRASETDPIRSMHALMEWLPENIPDDETCSIVHGDFRIDNLVFHPTEARVIGILDWELSTLGHPLADFAYHCLPYRLPPDLFNGIRGIDLAGAGIPSETSFIRAYCQRTDRTGIPHMDIYVIFCLFRLSAITQGIRGRIRDGTASSKHAARLGALAVPLAEEAWRLAKSLGAS
jgi:aminoglycoside phosphotransferase (APT) family kinase protein